MKVGHGETIRGSGEGTDLKPAQNEVKTVLKTFVYSSYYGRNNRKIKPTITKKRPQNFLVPRIFHISVFVKLSLYTDYQFKKFTMCSHSSTVSILLVLNITGTAAGNGRTETIRQSRQSDSKYNFGQCIFRKKV